eukprot:CAMPEP_0194772756 /NCGR_PEP_ID=MMETSP0323_2-20130528/52930_2 /TAXON_ID=2866 ORGANISM="Crypthecodinium cohnii, Strain Seligo" /NCGR_SAMPLE_ID=MMETSP0323_2 /ASSEMBLY_ACC=CAM_ASM_000346 /LENGTH=117 /DNA_ID= /DNA_START= /DNA_END= /DNA_ORIENTATION=
MHAGLILYNWRGKRPSSPGDGFPPGLLSAAAMDSVPHARRPNPARTEQARMRAQKECAFSTLQRKNPRGDLCAEPCAYEVPRSILKRFKEEISPFQLGLRELRELAVQPAHALLHLH